jgi:26S proteasome regulatory subunit N8
MVLQTQDGTQKSQKVFVNIPTEIGATEAEEIGVHLDLLDSMRRSAVQKLYREEAI